MSGIREWLDGLDLGEFAEAFEAERIDLDALPDITDADLKDIGLPIGSRRKILRAIADGAPASVPTQPREAERRQITVMFCDLVGSTALSEELDPEDLRSLMQKYQQAAGAVIERYGGHVAQYLGDGLMTYFGWPQAHEDDAERAVRASLDIVEAVGAMALQVRIGIATGPVVVGETGAGDASVPKLAVGETPNLAARLQGLAGPDEIVVGPSTRRLFGGTFELEDLGEQALKGIVEPIRAYRIAGVAATEGRFEAQHEHLTPLVGREAEMAMVMGRWEQAKAGEGQVIVLSGEPGIGKSRITQTLRERLADESHTRLRYQCSPYHTNSALHPFIEQIERAASFQRDDTPDRKLDKLERLFPNGVDGALVASLLSLPVARYPALTMSPQKQKEETLRVLAEQVTALAAAAPVLLIFEDAHWIDPTSQELLDLMVPAVAGHRVLAVITHRPEYEPPWPGQGHVAPMSLTRLGRVDAAVMAARVLDTPLSDDVLAQIVAKTDGVPLFVEELTKTVQESGADTANAIPETLQDSLMARLDRLSPVKEVAQLGACIGREFSHRVLAAVSPLRDNALIDALGQLVNSELVFRAGVPPNATYTFKHALVQDAAADSLLRGKRQSLHQQIAEALQSEMPEIRESSPELIAQHYARADNPVRALEFYELANIKAANALSLEEAMYSFEEAMECLDRIPESEDNRLIRVRMIVSNATVFQLLFRFPEYFELLLKYESVAEELGDAGLLGGLLVRKGHCEWALGELEQAAETLTMAAELCVGALNHRDAGYAHMLLAWTRMLQGRLLEGLEHRDKSIMHLQEDFDVRWQAWVLAAGCLINGWLGRWSDAAANGEEELELADRYSDESLASFAYWNLAFVHVDKGNLERAVELAQMGFDKAPTPGDASWSLAPLGWAHSLLGETVAGIAELETAVAGNRAGRFVWGEHVAVILAEAHLRAGDPAKARDELERTCPYLEKAGMTIALGIAERLTAEIGRATGWQDLSRQQATNHYARSVELLAEAGARNELANTLVAMGHYYAEGGDGAEARAHFSRALDIYEALGTMGSPQCVRDALASLPGSP
jgi:class 3 adenylate cyclase/tetratricopeptide (TPR) repeat protein